MREMEIFPFFTLSFSNTGRRIRDTSEKSEENWKQKRDERAKLKG